MAHKLTKLFTFNFIAGTPGRPAIPGYWLKKGGSGSTNVEVSGLASGTSGTGSTGSSTSFYSSIVIPPGQIGVLDSEYLRNQGVSDVFLRPDSGSGSLGIQGGSIYIPGSPAVPATPSRMSRESLVGWNGGARSVRGVSGGAVFAFELIGGTVGAICGISGAPDTISFGDYTHAFVIRDTQLVIYERGGESNHTYVPRGTRVKLRICRNSKGQVRYFVNSNQVHVSPQTSNGVIYLDALIYASGDFVDNPSITPNVVTGADTSFSFANTSDVVSFLSMPARVSFTVNGRTRSRSTTALSFYSTVERPILRYSMEVFASIWFEGLIVSDVGRSRAVYTSPRVLTGDMGGYARSVAKATAGRVESVYVGEVPDFIFSVATHLGGYGTRSKSIATSPANALNTLTRPRMWSVDSRILEQEGSWGRSAAVYKGVPRVISRADFSPNSFNHIQAILMLDTWECDNVANGSFRSGLGIGDSFLAVIYDDGGWADILYLQVDTSMEADLDLSFASRLLLTSGSLPNANNPIQIAVNADTGAVTTYNDFGFLRIVNTDEGTFGVRADGVYRIRTGDDDGAPINSKLDLGKIRFDSPTIKRIAAAYAGVATDGEVFFKFIDDRGEEFIYQALGEDPQYRAVTGKGAFSRQWRVQLELVEPSYAVLDNIEFDIGISTRRIRR